MSTQKKLIPPKELFQEKVLHTTEFYVTKYGDHSDEEISIDDIEVGAFFVFNEMLYRRIRDSEFTNLIVKRYVSMHSGELQTFVSSLKVIPVYKVGIHYSVDKNYFDYEDEEE